MRPCTANTLPPVAVAVSERELDDGTALSQLLGEYETRHPEQPGKAEIELAYNVARHAHAGQRRRSGEPYFVHPVRVSRTLTQLGLDAVSVAAALLHDAVEDSELTVFEVHERFGREVASIVDGVTKLGKVPYLSKQEQQAESFRKMLLAMSEDIRVLIVKLADRLDNMRTLGHMPRDKQIRISRETMQIYAPLAGRLGIEWLRRELQDLAFRYLEPRLFQATRSETDAFLRARPGIVARALTDLRMAFEEPVTRPDDPDPPTPWAKDRPLRFRVTMRPTFRIHHRLEVLARKPDQLSDVATFQVIVAGREACYAALGQLHARFQPVPGRFRDYIALPRPNQYQSIHTTIIDPHGQRLEVQIRSERMDAIAERGIIDRWKLDGTRSQHPSGRLEWLGQLMDWQEDVSDPQEFIEAVKAELFADEVYVFTPKGDIFTFPKGVTPIDFAFAIHTDVGMKCSGARVNGHLVPLRYRLRQGDTVEILTNPNVGPREEWLKMTISSRARAKIKHHLRQQERERQRSLGRTLLEQEIKVRGHSLSEYEGTGALVHHTEPMGLPRDAKGEDGVYEAIGSGQLKASHVAERLVGSEVEAEGETDRSFFGRVLSRMTFRRPPSSRDGVDAAAGRPDAPLVITNELLDANAVTLASCCSPIPGDPLIGAMEVGKGIVVHVEGCPAAFEGVAQNRVFVSWDKNVELQAPVTLEIRTANSVGLLAEMSRAFSQHEVDIRQAHCRTTPEGQRATNRFHATVRNRDQLMNLIRTLETIPGVFGVERVFEGPNTSASRRSS